MKFTKIIYSVEQLKVIREDGSTTLLEIVMTLRRIWIKSRGTEGYDDWVGPKHWYRLESKMAFLHAVNILMMRGYSPYSATVNVFLCFTSCKRIIRQMHSVGQFDEKLQTCLKADPSPQVNFYHTF